jgi:hypothetical protein
MRHSSHRAQKLRHVARSISGVICAKAAVTFCRRSASFCGFCPYTCDLTNHHHTKEFGGVNSGRISGPWYGPITAAPVIVTCAVWKLSHYVSPMWPSVVVLEDDVQNPI